MLVLLSDKKLHLNCKPLDGAQWQNDGDFTSLVGATSPQLSSELNAGMCFVNESQC